MGIIENKSKTLDFDFVTIPQEIIIKICSTLSHQDLVHFAITCTRFHCSVTSSNTLWNFLLQRDFYKNKEILEITDRDETFDTENPIDQYKRLIKFQKLNSKSKFKPKLELGTILADEFILNNKLKANKGIKNKAKPSHRVIVNKGPMTISLLFVGAEGSGISSLIAHMMNKYPYSGGAKFGNAPTAACAWYKKHCYAFQSCREISEQQISSLSTYDNKTKWWDVINSKIEISTIVLVLDCSRKEEAILNTTLKLFSDLKKLLERDFNSRPKSLMILAHKQDLIDCFSIKDLTEKFPLSLDQEFFLNSAILPTSILSENHHRCIEAAMDWIFEYSFKFDSTTVNYNRRGACGMCMLC